MNSNILILCIFLLGKSLFAQNQDFNLIDIQSEQAFELHIESKGTRVSIYLLDNNKDTLDSIYYRNLLWGATASHICDSLLMVSFPLRSGLGHFIEKVIILSVNDKKISISMNVILRETYDMQGMDPDFEEYKIELEFNECRLITSTEEYHLKLLDGTEGKWAHKSELKYLPDKGIFYNSLIELRTVIIEGKEKSKIEGLFYGIKLKKFVYIYAHDKWYLLLDDVLIPQ